MSLVAELRRRNVFRVGIAYVVVSWLVLQVADVMIDNIGAPDWLFASILMVLAIGFPLALLFAWAFELTPEGLKREKDVDRDRSIAPRTGRKLDFAIMGLLAIALAYFIWEARFAGRETAVATDTTQSATPDQAGAATEASSEPARPSIAVLPFDNRSRSADDEPFVEGVHDDLLTNLARIRDLKVISRTSVNQYKGTSKTIPEIASELDVTTIMEGAVQRAGDTVRINVQLIDAKTDEHLWAEIYDRELTAENLFAIQSEISSAIANALQAALTDDEQDRLNTMPTQNLAAYDAYVRGRQLMTRRESAPLEQAAAAFREAVTLDPEFALAWVGLGDSHALLASYGDLTPETTLKVHEEAVERALALDAQLGEAWASKGLLLRGQRRYDEAEAAFLRAIELSPGYATNYHWYSVLLSRYELRADERVASAEKATELDPRSVILRVNLGAAYEDQGRYLRAEREYLNALELDPDYPYALSQLGDLYSNMGRLAEAIRLTRRAERLDPGNPGYLMAQGWDYLELGDVVATERILSRLESEYPNFLWAGHLAMILSMHKGNDAGALEIANSLVPRIEAMGGNVGFMGMLHLWFGNLEQARIWTERAEPGWKDPERWRALIEEYDEAGCAYAFLLMRTGEPEAGETLARDTRDYLTEELAGVDEHADLQGAELCHLALGDTEAALDALQTQLDHNHIGAWRQWASGPIFEPLAGNSRFESLLAENDRRVAQEREKLADMDGEEASL